MRLLGMCAQRNEQPGNGRSTSLARTPIDKHAAKAKADCGSKHGRGQRRARCGTTGAAGQENTRIRHCNSPESQPQIHERRPLERLSHGRPRELQAIIIDGNIQILSRSTPGEAPGLRSGAFLLILCASCTCGNRARMIRLERGAWRPVCLPGSPPLLVDRQLQTRSLVSRVWSRHALLISPAA